MEECNAFLWHIKCSQDYDIMQVFWVATRLLSVTDKAELNELELTSVHWFSVGS